MTSIVLFKQNMKNIEKFSIAMKLLIAFFFLIAVVVVPYAMGIVIGLDPLSSKFLFVWAMGMFYTTIVGMTAITITFFVKLFLKIIKW